MSEVSFMSEHSIEYLLVHQICSYLNNSGFRSTPLFFWSTREGNKLGRECFQGKTIRILAIYPRRPKVKQIDDDIMEFKINHSIISPSMYLHNFGIPVFVGGPLISTLDDFHMDSKIFIARFNDKLDYKGHPDDEHFRFNKTGKVLCTSTMFRLSEMDGIIDAINHDASLMKWHEAIEILQKRKLYDAPGSKIFLARRAFVEVNYKPVYIVIH